MSRYKLHHLSLCNQFYTAYMVPEQDGNPVDYCYDCWESRFATQGYTDLYQIQPVPQTNPSDKERKPDP